MSRLSALTVVLVGLVLCAGGPAQAADPPAAPGPGTAPAPPPPSEPPSGKPTDMPPPTAAAPAADAPTAAPADLNPPTPSATGTPAGVVSATPDDVITSDHTYGVGARGRLVMVPKWLLDTFTKQNVPLSTGGIVFDGFRRGENFDLVLSLGYQNMSPGDGNWLGRGKAAAEDTDFVQFRDLALWTADVSFIWRTTINEWFGLHYGAGIGVGIFSGKMLRTSASNCTEANAGNVNECYPVCDGRKCNEAQLTGTQGTGIDEVGNPHRFVDNNVPGAIPIVNVVIGATFKIPTIRGWEAKIEGGFYDAFFVGGGFGYVFW